MKNQEGFCGIKLARTGFEVKKDHKGSNCLLSAVTETSQSAIEIQSPLKVAEQSFGAVSSVV